MKKLGGLLIVYVSVGFFVDAYLYWKNAPTGAKYRPSINYISTWPFVLYTSITGKPWGQ